MIGIVMRIVGALVSLAVPWVTQKYGEAAGTAVVAVGGAILHQSKPITKK